MKTLLLLILFVILSLITCKYLESKIDPYDEGMHFDYTITCENGFVYKSMPHKGTIQVFNSDGTPLKCKHKIY